MGLVAKKIVSVLKKLFCISRCVEGFGFPWELKSIYEFCTSLYKSIQTLIYLFQKIA